MKSSWAGIIHLPAQTHGPSTRGELERSSELRKFICLPRYDYNSFFLPSLPLTKVSIGCLRKQNSKQKNFQKVFSKKVWKWQQLCECHEGHVRRSGHPLPQQLGDTPPHEKQLIQRWLKKRLLSPVGDSPGGVMPQSSKGVGSLAGSLWKPPRSTAKPST